MPKHVVSSTLKEATLNARIINRDVAAELSRLKSQPGKNILKYGNGDVDRTLVAHRLVDEFRFCIFPVTVGKGRRVFEGIDTTGLTLTLLETKTFSNGIVRVRYAAAYK